jgi:uncharacterized protein
LAVGWFVIYTYSPIILFNLPISSSWGAQSFLLLIQTMKTMHPTYNLKPAGVNGSGGFYKRLSGFTTQWLEKDLHAKRMYIDSFLGFTIRMNSRNIRTPEEAYLEFLTLGIYLENYSDSALGMFPVSSRILVKLFGARKNNPGFKKMIDKVRGFLAYLLLLRNSVHKENQKEISIKLLLNWLAATGEFNQEIDRLSDWQKHLETLPSGEKMVFIQAAKQSAMEFYHDAQRKLGDFTTNINQFLQEQPMMYRFRENYFFTARKENEYFLNLVGAEIINRVERQNFLATTNKMLLLPACMRKLTTEKCKAVFDGKGMLCQGCNTTCNIHIAAGTVGYKGVKTYIIHHSSMFSESLKLLASDKDTGIIGVACALNLLAGGYELKKQGIPAQCIFLDYSGCKKHWLRHEENVPTTIQLNRLTELVG